MRTAAEAYDADMKKFPNNSYTYIYNFGDYVFDIAVKRISITGVWNGYVTLPVGCKIPDDLDDLSVHGGITYTGHDASGRTVLGFDTAHMYDYSPFMRIFAEESTYRSHEYVLSECEKLCRQLV